MASHYKHLNSCTSQPAGYVFQQIKDYINYEKQNEILSAGNKKEYVAWKIVATKIAKYSRKCGVAVRTVYVNIVQM